MQVTCMIAVLYMLGPTLQNNSAIVDAVVTKTFDKYYEIAYNDFKTDERRITTALVEKQYCVNFNKEEEEQ